MSYKLGIIEKALNKNLKSRSLSHIDPTHFVFILLCQFVVVTFLFFLNTHDWSGCHRISSHSSKKDRYFFKTLLKDVFFNNLQTFTHFWSISSMCPYFRGNNWEQCLMLFSIKSLLYILRHLTCFY